ncbi:hypothetical protein BDP81DRAFT_402432 [Colletotrichum phormii]|uniref:Uncharacterized protein n=1 Tax=Colletotrichum phormii TaxID=359342 RepID=A0AAJ0A0N7_9PEZI|nr:uncharacterized protein BDP81DRAFT_402432 [Colletotrichum phormii]KAK1654283.1 hypothetical protein BDP81DRAFT_402432 [Colletotrichum phormii]
MDTPLLQNMVLKFLNQLQKSVSESTEIVGGKRQPKEKMLVEAMSHPQAHEYDSSGSSSCSDELEKSTDDESQTELGQNSEEIDDIISSLFAQDEERNTVDVFSVYSVFDRRHVEEWILQLRKSSEATFLKPKTAVHTTSDEVDYERSQSHVKASIFKDNDKRLIDR